MIPEQDSVYIDGDVTQNDLTLISILPDESFIAEMSKSVFNEFLKDSKQ